MMGVATEPALIEWEVKTFTAPGELECGDLHVVRPFAGGVLAAVIDGLGHGSEAAYAAKIAAGVLVKHAGAPVIRLVELCHSALRATRGAVMTLVSFDYRESTLTALGVGNVETLLLHADASAEQRCEPVLLRSGIVGSKLPPLQAGIFAMAAGDMVVFATDGVRGGVAEEASAGGELKTIVDRTMACGLRGDDDALVLAVRYRGRSG